MTEKQVVKKRSDLITTVKKTNLTQNEIAALAGLHQSAVARMFAAKFSPTLDNFIKVADATGLKISLTAKD